MFSRFGATEIIILLALVLLVYGAKKFPDFMENLGIGIKKFRNSQKDDDQSDDPKA
jgi:sec-independent protein translocase protein TatA